MGPGSNKQKYTKAMLWPEMRQRMKDAVGRREFCIQFTFSGVDFNLQMAQEEFETI